MTDKDLYSTILGICLPWQVTDVALSVEKATVTVTLDYDASQSKNGFACPTCGKSAAVYDRREKRTWRHLDSMQFQTYLVASLPRISCPTHGIVTHTASRGGTASVSWTEPSSRFTLLFEAFAIRVLQATGVQSRAAALLRLNPGQVHDLMQRAVGRGLARRAVQAETLQHLSVDEKSHKEGHQYITVISDPLGKRVLDVAEGRTQEAVENLFRSTIDEAQRDEVRSVSMDMSQVCDSMWPAFMSAREKVFPNAQTVHDRFHVASYLGAAVDRTRKDEHRTLTRHDDTTLNKTKYLWLRSEATLTEKQRTALDQLTSLDLETSKVWAFKESFRAFFQCTTVDRAANFFDNWFEGALALGNYHLTRVANMLSNHIEGLFAYIECPVTTVTKLRDTNAAAEGLNALIQQIKANAKGYRKWENFRIAILFHLGKLDMKPHKSS